MNHQKFMDIARIEAEKSLKEGGLPIGAVMVRNNEIISKGYNRRVQDGNPIAHGEMSCLMNAGRQKNYKDTILYTTLSPCMMCSGTIVQFKIPQVVIGEAENFEGNIAFLKEHGVNVVLLEDEACINMMKRFIEQNPVLWNEDISE